MKSSVKRISLSLLLAFAAIVFCVFGVNFIRNDNATSAQAASATQTDVKIETDKDTVAQGETITFTVTITSGQPSSKVWSAIDFVIGPAGDEKASGAANTISQYFELDTSYGDELTGLPYIANIHEFDEEIGDMKYTYSQSSNYQVNNNLVVKRGFNISCGLTDEFSMPANIPVTFKYRLKVKDNAPNIAKVDFGLYKVNTFLATYENATGGGSVRHTTGEGSIVFNTKSIRIGSISHDADLKSLNAGHGTSSDSVNVSENMTYVSTSADTTNFKVKPTVDSTASILYGVGASNPTPTESATSGTDISVPLESSGVTVVKFKITAEDGTTTKDYTLTITSAYARLSKLVSNLVRPSGAPSVSGTGLTSFDKDTETYTVKVPSDCTALELTPTILTGYGATGGAITATGCSSDASTLSDNGKITITNITDNSTVALNVIAKDGSTTKTYTLTFDVVNVNTDISSFTMTEDITGTTVNNDASKAPAGGYYFKLSEESGFSGTFNITLAESTSSVKIGTADYNPTTKYGANTYSVVVTAEAGNTKTYSVVVAKDVKAGDIKDIQFSIKDKNSPSSVTSDEGWDGATYTLTKQYDPADYPANTKFYVLGTPTAETTVTPTGMTATSGGWEATLKEGKNTFKLVAHSSTGDTTYNFVINLIEGKNSITDLKIKDKAGNELSASDFSFDPSIDTYNINVPFKNFDYVTFEATTDGVLTTVMAIINGTDKDFTRTSTANVHTYGSAANTAIRPSGTTTIKIYGWADKKTGEKGTVYTFNFERAAADTSAKLDNLVLTIDGTTIYNFDGGVTFDSDTFTYNYTIEPTGNPTATINIAATAQSATATVTAGNAATKLDPDNITYTFPSSTSTTPYIITVTSESGAKQNYTINIKRVVMGGDFEEIEVSPDNSFFESIFSEFTGAGTSSAPKMATKEYNVSTAAVNSKFYVKVRLNSSDAQAVGSTGFTLNGDTFEGTLGKFGENVFNFSAKTGTGTTYYRLTVKLVEDLNGITDIQLKPSKGTIDNFSFNPYQDNYDIDVDFDVSAVTITVAPEGQYEFVYETGDKILKKVGTAYEKTSLALKMGDTTTIVIYGKSNNGTGEKGQEYTLNFNRAQADADTLLSDLVVTIDGQPVNFGFDPGTTDYTILVPDDVLAGNPSSLPIAATATAQSSTATVTGDGNKTLTINSTETRVTYTITVTAQSGATNTYNITVKREIKSGDFSTLEFADKGSNYEDVFTSSYYDASSKTYTVDLSLDSYKVGDKVSVRAVPTGGATVTIRPAISGSNNVYQITLAQGTTTYEFTAKSSTGQETYTFVINLFEAKNTIENIQLYGADGKEIPSDMWNKAFAISTTDYEITLPHTVSSLKMTVTTDGSFCEVVDDKNNAFAKSSIKTKHEKTITLAEGATEVLVFRAVSDKGDDGEYYTFVIYRELPNSDTTLKKLEVSIGGTLYEFAEGAFDPDLLFYTIQVEEGKSSGSIKIVAEANAATSKVTGDGTKSFTLSDSDATVSYPVTVTAESGDERTYTITISQKPLVLDSDTTITRIVISASGQPTLFDGVPDYYNNVEDLVVDNKITSVNIVVTVQTGTTTSVIETSPNTIASGNLRLEVGDNSVKIYAVAQDGTNKDGIDAYLFNIVRSKPKGIGPDTHIKFGDNDEQRDFNINDEEALVYTLSYDYKQDKLELEVKLDNGGTYSVTKIIQGEEEPKKVVTDIESGTNKKIALDYGTNVFCITVESVDGRTTRSVVYIVERDGARFDKLSSPEISELENDYKKNPYKDEFTYQVSTYTDTVNFNVDVDDNLDYEIDKPATLGYGLNKCTITIYEKGNDRSSAAIRTITVNVLREKDTNFWFIMFWVLLALVLVELIIIFLVRRNKKNNGPDEPAIIVTPSAAPVAQQPIQQQGQTYYIPPQDGQY